MEISPSRLFEKHIEDMDSSSRNNQFSISNPGSPRTRTKTTNLNNLCSRTIFEQKATDNIRGPKGKLSHDIMICCDLDEFDEYNFGKISAVDSKFSKKNIIDYDDIAKQITISNKKGENSSMECNSKFISSTVIPNNAQVKYKDNCSSVITPSGESTHKKIDTKNPGKRCYKKISTDGKQTKSNTKRMVVQYKECIDNQHDNSKTEINSGMNITVSRKAIIKHNESKIDCSRLEHSLEVPEQQITDLNNDSASKRKRDQKTKHKEKQSEGIDSLSSYSTDSKVLRRNKRRKRNQRAAKNSKMECIDLSQRRDVINKTILRALRRYYANELKISSIKDESQEEKSPKTFLENVKEYGNIVFGAKNKDILALQYFLAYIINPKEIDVDSMQVNEAIHHERLNLFYNGLYKYSHSKLVSLFSDQHLAVIYSNFYLKAKEMVLENETAMSKNRELYSKILDEFDTFFKLEDKSSIGVT